MSVLAHHAALVGSIAALTGASVRIASLWAPGGIERVLAAAAVGCTVVALEALALGLVGLGGSTIALSAAALATWAATRRLAPSPSTRVGTELAAWWRALGRGSRIAWGAGIAAFAWWAAWAVVWPPIGFDASLYQYAEVLNWVRGGHPGSVQQVSYEFPVGNYPLANEVLLAWGAGLARSFVPLIAWPAATWALCGLAGWSGLRALAGSRVAAAGVAAVLTIPGLFAEVGEADTDLPALAWLATAGALALAARRRPALMAPVLLAAGLAIGTKTTVAPLAVAIVIAGWLASSPRPRGRALAVAGAASLVVGGLWYVRNLIDHGSPFWPFRPGPFGDPTPRWLATVDTTFLQRPRATLSQVPLRAYGRELGGGLALLGAALVAPFVVRKRAVIAAGLVTAAALVLWMNAPATGVPDAPGIFDPAGWPESTMRYLVPVLATGAVTMAIAAGHGRPWVTAAVIALFSIAALVNVAVLVNRGAPLWPPLQVLAAAVVGALLLAAATGMRQRSLPGPALAAGGIVIVVGGLSLAAGGLVERHAGVESSTALGKDVVSWLSRQPGFADGDEPVAIASRAMIAPVAGDRLRHSLELIPAREPCTRVLERARRGWVITSEPDFARGFLGVDPVTSPLCLRGERPVFSGKNFDVYRVR